MEDEVYQKRFVKCMINHYKDRYELHIFESASEFIEETDKSYRGYILGESVAKKMELSEEQKRKMLVLSEKNKYQEVYKLVETLEILLDDEMKSSGAMTTCIVGVSSFTVPYLQLPFSAILSGIYGEQGKSVLLDFQANSGLFAAVNNENWDLGMEDVLAMSVMGNYSKSRFLSAIGHYSSWDYVYPVKNSECLEELSGEIIGRIVLFLSKELEYQTIVINFGDGIMDVGEFMSICNHVYLLYPKGDTGNWREKSYVHEMERRGKDDIFHRIHRVEVPSILSADASWEGLVEQWKWNNTGDYLRKVIREAGSSG